MGWRALASMAYDAVGQYAMHLVAVDVGTWLVSGTVLPGSQLRYSTAEGKDPGDAPPGNWRLHGRTTKADNLVLGTFRFGGVLAKLTEPFGAPLEKLCHKDMGDFGA